MENEKYIKAIGKRIKELRLERDMTQVDLADYLETNKSSINRMEAGGNNFTINTLLKIAEALDISIQELLPKTK